MSGSEGLERLGDSVDFGELIIDLIEKQGWLVHRRRAFGGGYLLIAVCGELEARGSGATLAAAANSLFSDASSHFGGLFEHNQQLQLDRVPA